MHMLINTKNKMKYCNTIQRSEEAIGDVCVYIAWAISETIGITGNAKALTGNFKFPILPSTYIFE